MIVNSQGFGHFVQHLNNQDFAYETSRMLLVLDGCSGAKYSEVGAKIFVQLFSRKEERDSVEKFESNVKEVFDDLIEMMRKYYPDSDSMENEFIMENLLFTIIACFDTADKYIVKMFGDGYIIAQNMQDRLSYMKFSYGKCPPYFAYRYCNLLNPNIFKDYTFKTFEFDKKTFKSVGIASDGILPCIKGAVQLDTYILKRDVAGLRMELRMHRQSFDDDATIAFFESENSDVLNVQSADTNEIKSVKGEIIFDKKVGRKLIKQPFLDEKEEFLNQDNSNDITIKALETALFGEKTILLPSVIVNEDVLIDKTVKKTTHSLKIDEVKKEIETESKNMDDEKKDKTAVEKVTSDFSKEDKFGGA